MNVTTAHEKNGDEGGVLSQAIRIGAISALFVVCLLLRQTTVLSQGSHPTFWASHPYSGVKKQWLSWLRATIRSIFGSKVMIDEGYAKVRLFARKDGDYSVLYGISVLAIKLDLRYAKYRSWCTRCCTTGTTPQNL